MDDAIKNGYVKAGAFKEKNASAWSQPKDPLQVKMEKLLADVSNIYSEDLYQHKKIELETFLPNTEMKFVKAYEATHFENLVMVEQGN